MGFGFLTAADFGRNPLAETAGSKGALDLLLNGLGVALPFIEQGPLLVSWVPTATGATSRTT